MRTSRIDSFGGMRPPVKPSIKICPPFGPADGPAIACTAAESASGSSGSTSRSWPLSTTASALFAGSVLKPCSSVTVMTCFSSVTTRRTS